MKNSAKNGKKSNNLRMRAEEILLKTPSAIKKMPARALKDLIEDLQIHQVELEMQGEELRRSQFELEQTRDRYLDLYDFAPVGYFTLSEKGIILEANLMVTTLLGVERSTLMGMPFFRFIAKEDQDLFYLHRKALQASGHVETCELKLVKKDGRKFHAQLESIMRESNRGEPVGIVSIVQDVSERKNAEKELRLSEKRYHMMIEHMNSGVAVYETKDEGASFVFKDFNSAAEKISNIKKKQVIGKELLSVFPKMDRFGLVDVLKRVWKTGKDEKLQARYYRDDLRQGWRDNRVYKLPSGEVVAIYDDVTDKMEAERKLEESEKRLRTVLETVALVAIMLDRKGEVTFCNDCFLELTGWSREEVLGKDWFENFVPVVIRDDLKKTTFLKVIESGEFPLHHESKILTKTGERRLIAWNNTAFFDEKGEVFCSTGIGEDITERRKGDEELRQAHKMEAIGTLAGGIAHEFNNVLGIILGNTELAMDDVPDWNPARESLNEIRTASLRAKDVVGQILSFARKTMTDLNPMEINTVVMESLKLMRASIPTMIEIRSDLPPEPLMILGHPTEIHQIVMNLCNNAHYAMKKGGGVLEVNLRNEDLGMKNDELGLEPGKYIKLTVMDSGEGMAPDILKNIFDPYFTTKEVGEGSGMGLAVVYGLVKKCNGVIHVRSEVGEGTVVEILFPKIGEEAPPTTEFKEELPTGKERILLVDDEKSIVKMVQQLLERLGYTVVGITDSVEALEQFRANPKSFDLVITDMAMPRMAGDQLASELMKINRNIPILLCTGHSEQMDEDIAKKMGIKGFAMKPVEKGELARSVREVLDGR